GDQERYAPGIARLVAVEWRVSRDEQSGAVTAMCDRQTRPRPTAPAVAERRRANRTAQVVQRVARRTGVSRPLSRFSSASAARRETVIVNDYEQLRRMAPGLLELGVCAAVGVPMLHGGRLLGVAVVVSDDPDKQFSDDEAELLEMLGSIAASSLVALERNQA